MKTMTHTALIGLSASAMVTGTSVLIDGGWTAH
jgi:hypothetical protein